MIKVLKLRRNYKNYLSFYNILFRLRVLSYKIIRKQTCDIRFPIFLNKLILFRLRGIVARKHKCSINSTITVGSYVSNTKLYITFPLNYNAVKIN
jgi:hypothetical protein